MVAVEEESKSRPRSFRTRRDALPSPRVRVTSISHATSNLRSLYLLEMVRLHTMEHTIR